MISASDCTIMLTGFLIAGIRVAAANNFLFDLLKI